MTEPEIYQFLLALVFVLSGVVLLVLAVVSAPYGRHGRAGWGPSAPERLGWMVMESPSVVLFAAVFFAGPGAWEVVPLIMLGLWQAHYVYRTVVYPLRLRSQPGRRMPVVVIGMGFIFNGLNSYLNARWLTAMGPGYEWSWMLSARFLGGLFVFMAGFVINRWADATLRNLRKPGEGGYSIPQGGLYRVISCPNYFGELLQWLGWSILTWSLAGLSFTVFTAANLIPRAVYHHRWYQRTFSAYPRRRKAIIPYIL